MAVVVSVLSAAEYAVALPDLVDLLVACVAGGSSVGFLAPLDPLRAQYFWADVLADPASVTLVARDGRRVVGTVRLALAGQDNGRHRAEVAKLLVHPDARRRGIGEALMAAVERQAVALGRSTLVLDTETGSPAERLYQRWGWTVVGVIPEYALATDGRLHATTVLTKRLPGLPLDP